MSDEQKLVGSGQGFSHATQTKRRPQGFSYKGRGGPWRLKPQQSLAREQHG
jgi:hypothetical protein